MSTLFSLVHFLFGSEQDTCFLSLLLFDPDMTLKVLQRILTETLKPDLPENNIKVNDVSVGGYVINYNPISAPISPQISEDHRTRHIGWHGSGASFETATILWQIIKYENVQYQYLISSSYYVLIFVHTYIT